MNEQISFVGAVKKGLSSWRDYKGASPRREYWFFMLATFLVGAVLSTIEQVAQKTMHLQDSNPVTLTQIVQMLFYVWALPLLVRRFHDAGFSGYWLLLGLLPLVVAVLNWQAITDVFSSPAWVASMAGNDITETQALDLFSKIGAAFGLPMLLAFLVSIFQLVVTLLPSKPTARGNRFVK